MTYEVVFENPSPALQKCLLFDVDEIAVALQKLREGGPLAVYQMVNVYKDSNTYISDDEGKLLGTWFPTWRSARLVIIVCSFILITSDLHEAGKFSVDLYTLPNILKIKLSEYLVSRHSVSCWDQTGLLIGEVVRLTYITVVQGGFIGINVQYREAVGSRKGHREPWCVKLPNGLSRIKLADQTAAAETLYSDVRENGGAEEGKLGQNEIISRPNFSPPTPYFDKCHTPYMLWSWSPLTGNVVKAFPRVQRGQLCTTERRQSGTPCALW